MCREDVVTSTSLDLSCTWKVSLGVGVGVEGVIEGGGDGLLLVSPASHKERPAPGLAKRIIARRVAAHQGPQAGPL